MFSKIVTNDKLFKMTQKVKVEYIFSVFLSAINPVSVMGGSLGNRTAVIHAELQAYVFYVIVSWSSGAIQLTLSEPSLSFVTGGEVMIWGGELVSMRAEGPSAAPAASNWRGCGGATPAKIFENLEPYGAFSCILSVKLQQS